MFETKTAILIDPALQDWQKLNVTAFLATGLAGSAPEAMGAPYLDASGQPHAALFGQPILIFAADHAALCRTRSRALARGLICAGFVRGMFTTGHDAANRAVFAAEDPAAPDLVGLALHGPRAAIDKAVKGVLLHP